MSRSDFLILDGGLATQLEARGNNINNPMWSARLLRDAPDEIRAVHRDYLQAGADIITSASYQATYPGFARLGLTAEQVTDVLQQSVRMAKVERDLFVIEGLKYKRRPPRVAASIGPYGAFLANGAEYTGNYDVGEQQLSEFHWQRWSALAIANPDIMLFETVPSIVEVGVIFQMIDQRPLSEHWISFSCRDGSHISDGTPIRECARLIESDPHVVGIGINCTAPHLINSLIDEVRLATNKTLIVYPNSGESYNAVRKSWSGDSNVVDFAQQAQQWLDRGANVIGGCCRTTPDHIRAIKEMRDAVQG